MVTHKQVQAQALRTHKLIIKTKAAKAKLQRMAKKREAEQKKKGRK